MKTFTEKYWASMMSIFAIVFFLSVIILVLSGILDPYNAFSRDHRSIFVYDIADNRIADVAVDPLKTMAEPHTKVVWHNKSYRLSAFMGSDFVLGH